MFVDALGSDNHSSTIIETLVDLAGSMRMDIIAEGVETFEQVIALRERGIRTAQGYVFAPPLPAPRSCSWSRRSSRPHLPYPRRTGASPIAQKHRKSRRQPDGV